MTEDNERSWIGVDLDGTLAHYDGWRGIDHIGAPLEPMVKRVKVWLAEGQEVRLMTARADEQSSSYPTFLKAWENWSEEVFGEILPVTNRKDFLMLVLYDDRAIQVEHNTGVPLDLL